MSGERDTTSDSNIMKDRLTNLVLRGSTLSVKFIFILVLAAYLPPEEVGLYGLITVTVSYSIYFVGFEFYTYSTRDLVARPPAEWPKLLSTQLVFFCVLYAAVLPLLVGLFYFNMLPWTVLVWFLLLVVAEHLSTELMRLLVALQRPLVASCIIFIKQALWALCFLFWMWLFPDHRNISTLLIFWLAGAVLAIVVGSIPLYELRWKGALQRLDWRWVRSGFHVAIPLLISSVAVKTLFTADRYLFGELNSLALLGAYSVYMGVASAILSFMESGVFVFYYPAMMKSYKNKDLKGYLKSYAKLRRQSFIWLLFLAVGAAFAGIGLFPHLSENIYENNLMLFFGIVAAVVIFVAGYVFQYALYAAARDRVIIFSNVAGLLVFIVSFGFSYKFSAYWAVTLAMVLGCLASTTLKAYYWGITHRQLQESLRLGSTG